MRPEVGIGERDVADALVVAVIAVMNDEGGDLVFEIARQVIVFQQDAVVQGLMPTFNLALRHRVIWCTAEVVDVFVIEPKPSVFLRAILTAQ